MPDAGRVYYLPPEVREGPNKGDRPHLVLSLCSAEAETVTFAYGSTQGTDAAHGAAHQLVDPFATSFRGTGLSQPTYFYPSRLISYSANYDFPEPAGRIIDELPQIRALLKRGLGFGTGVTFERDRRGRNRRGRIAEYVSDYAEIVDARFCLIVTEPTYSRTGFQQTTIPLLDANDFDERPGDVLVRGPGWARAVMGRRADVIIAAPLIQTVYEPEFINRYHDSVLDESTMRQVESALALHFGL